METHPHRSYATLWAERTLGCDMMMAVPKFPTGKLWLPFCRFPESGSFSEAFSSLMTKYRFRSLEDPELIIRCYRKENFMWRNVIFKTDIEVSDASVWHRTSKHPDFQYAKYRSSEFLDDRSNILSHRIMNVKFFKKPLTADEEQLFESAAFTKARIDALCCIFMDMIWPCELFDMSSFRTLLSRLYNGDLRNTKAMFRTCTSENGFFAEPSEVLKLLACLEPSSSGSTRFDFIFRLYAENRSNELSADQLKPLIHKICQDGQLTEGIAQQTRKFYADMFHDGKVSIHKFRNILTGARESLRRTQDILRAPYSLFCNPNIEGYDVAHTVETNGWPEWKDFPAYCRSSDWKLRIPSKARFVDPLPWWRFYDASFRGPLMGGRDDAVELRNYCSSTSEPSSLLDDLKSYASHRSDGTSSWADGDTSDLAQKFLSVCATVREIFEAEPRLLLLESPLYIFGDLHGSYKDLLFFERAFWRLGPHIAPSSYLFLGNYVDHGPSSLAVVGHLFACKILARHNFFLLRGIHEDRRVNRRGGLLDECRKVFGSRGPEVHSAINSVFDVLPLAAVVDKKLFCVHGGIPEAVSEPPYLGAIYSVEVELSHPRDDPIASELLWNCPNHQLNPKVGYVAKSPDCVGKLFGPAVVENFLKQFNMSFVIRAHHQERKATGSRSSEQLITLNSSTETETSSKTSTACILASDGNIRYIRFFLMDCSDT